MTEINTVADVLNIPGFELVSHEPGYTVLKIPSGFVLGIRRLGPYAFDHLDQREDLRDPGPFMITVRVLENLAPPGVEETILYSPPTDDDGNIYEPDREQHERAWVNYQKWKTHEQHRRDVLRHRDRVRNDIALLNGIEFHDNWDAELNEDDAKWMDHLRTSDFVEPKTLADRRLLYLKTRVITTDTTADVIRFFLRVKEVTTEGLKSAFDSFRRQMGWQTSVQSDG